MSTHNIGFYEHLTKLIFELSSNIIKYTPYFFCWHYCNLVFYCNDYFILGCLSHYHSLDALGLKCFVEINLLSGRDKLQITI